MTSIIKANSLEQAKGRLERVRSERESTEQAARDEAHAIPFGQPNIEGRGNIYKHVQQQWDRTRRLADEEERAADRVDMLEKVEKLKEENDQLQDVRVVGRTGWASVGAATSVNNLDYFKGKLAQMITDNEDTKAWNKTHKNTKRRTFGSKITALRKKVSYLEAMKNKADSTPISEHSQQLIDSGKVIQWKKKPIYYFVNGLRKVALTLDNNGDFQESKRYPAREDSDRETVQQLLAH
jgi:flagellar basal body P-ring protein FlgI